MITTITILPIQSEDIYNNTNSAINDHRILAANLVADERGNRVQSASLTGISRAADSMGGLAAADGTAVAAFLEAYKYDKAGNILSLSHNISDARHSSWKREFQYAEKSSAESVGYSHRMSSTIIGTVTALYL